MTSTDDAVTTIENSTPALTISVPENDAHSNSIGLGEDRSASVTISSSQRHDQPKSTSNQDTGKSQDNDKEITDPTNTSVSYPQVDFPFTFYKFINEVAVSHPHIVAWSECGNYFKIDRHAKELSSLIGQYFQRKCLYANARPAVFIQFCF